MLSKIKKHFRLLQEQHEKFVAEHPAVSAPTLILPRHQKPTPTTNTENGNENMNDDFSSNHLRGFFDGATPEEMEELQKSGVVVREEDPQPTPKSNCL